MQKNFKDTRNKLSVTIKNNVMGRKGKKLTASDEFGFFFFGRL